PSRIGTESATTPDCPLDQGLASVEKNPRQQEPLGLPHQRNTATSLLHPPARPYRRDDPATRHGLVAEPPVRGGSGPYAGPYEGCRDWGHGPDRLRRREAVGRTWAG